MDRRGDQTKAARHSPGPNRRAGKTVMDDAPARPIDEVAAGAGCRFDRLPERQEARALVAGALADRLHDAASGERERNQKDEPSSSQRTCPRSAADGTM